MAKDNKGPIVTKKHLARVERERMQRRYILITSGIIIAIVLLLIGWGIAKTYIVEPAQTVVSIDDTEISSRRFQAYARFTRSQLIDQYAQYYQFLQWFEEGSDNQTSLLQTLSQINYQLEPEYLGQNTIDALIEAVLIRKEAANRGITVTEDEIDRALESYMGFYPDGTPTSEPQVTPAPTSTLTELQQTLVPATPTLAPTEELTEQPTEVPATPTQAAAEEVAPTAVVETEPTATSEPSPTPTVYTEKLFNQNLNSYQDYAEIKQSDLRWIFETQLLRNKLYQDLTKDVAKDSDQVWGRQIVVADEATAKTVIERLNSGEDFAVLAAEVSTDQASSVNGGDIGWVGLGAMDQAVEKIVFNLDIGQISDPIQTTIGWTIFQVLGHEVRPIPASDYQQILDSIYDDWLTTARAAAQVDIKDIYIERVPTEPSIPASLSLGS